MTSVLTVPTSGLDLPQRGQIRNLLDVAFEGRFDDHDWDHTLGGLHFVVNDGDEPVAHAAVVQRRFLHLGRSWRVGYVEGVAVHPAYRKRGLASAVMSEAERVIDASYPMGALSASRMARGLYLARGWLPWQGSTWVLAPGGPARTPGDDDSTFVRVVTGGAKLRPTDVLTCDWRDGDVW